MGRGQSVRCRWSPSSTTIVRSPRSAAARPSAAAIVVLPTPPLPVTTTSLRSSADDVVVMGPTIPQMSAPAPSPIDEQVVYDERGLVPCVVQDWRTGEVLTLAYMNARGAAAHTRDGRAAPVQPLARAGMAQGRNQRQRPGGPCAAAGLRRRHAAGAGGARRPRLSHGRAHLLSPRRARTERAARGPARAGADAARSRSRAARGLIHRDAARRSRAGRREGARGGRGGHARRARGVR